MSHPFIARTRALLPRASDWQTARRHPRQNLLAGLTVSLVALPLALAFGVASGAGAGAGLVTAIVAGAVAAVFGGSNLQVSGPTGAMTVVLIPVVHRFGVDGVLTVGLLAGAILVLAAVLRLGRAARYLPAPVIEGFTAGIAVVIVLQQVPAALGAAGGGDKAWQSAWSAVRHFAADPHPWPLAIALGVAAVMLAGVHWRPGVPFSLLAIAVVAVTARLTHLPVVRIGSLPEGLSAPSLGFLDPGSIGTLLPSALAVAALGALESLLSATVADGMTVGQRHDPDRELFGQGLANLVVPLFGGVPATAAIARTAVNVRSGGNSRLAACTHALGLAAVVYLAAPWVSQIPVAALAGVLIATCVQMVEVGSLATLARATRSDAVVLAATFAVTVAVDLVTAVTVGIAVAVVLALRAVARSSQLEQVPLDAADHAAEEFELLSRNIVAYRLDGPLFFAAAHRFLLELTEVADVRVIILRLSRLTTVDATGAHVLGDAISRLEHRGITVLLSGIRPQHGQVLRRLGVAEHLRRDGLIFRDTPAAIGYARTLLGAADPIGQPAAP
ncbi:SulP family inorganic anion transporter [Jatrophihabitans cynanchi]|uniref:SulP family inorganic anion transporter n=1 Tax=Jatrophihabitans cynanchi TaxID=2944128 RepID=A0ABY7K1V5_9ACTN|nr:SulP family inorganic anion transporter [Jatrophihabitans sp. SB3-54]WAX58823.1 SulP family inorganic anion transporter [Jatrophihabitans sp. SB3-54]